MTSPTSPYPCVVCGAPATLAAPCPGCGRAPDPAAAEVIRLDGEIHALNVRVEQARQAYATLAATLHDLRQRRNDLATRVRAAAFVAGPAPARLGPPPTTGVRPEASTRTVQNLLFILGGLLLGTAAVVFTAVAWATFGIAGRAVILAVLTVLTLAAPPLALRRSLTATAETFAAVGLLLVLLDGYAAWYVDLLGVAGWPGTRYAALVCAVTAAVAMGYTRLTGLAAPRFAALVAAQPVLPLLAVVPITHVAGASLVLAATAALDLALIRRVRGAGVAHAVRITAWVAYAALLVEATRAAFVALAAVRGVGAGVPLVVVALLLVAGGVVARSAMFQAVAGGALVMAVAAAALRPVAELRGSLLLGSALVVVGLVAAVAAAGRFLPTAVQPGPRVAGHVLVGVLAGVVTVMTLVVAAATVLRTGLLRADLFPADVFRPHFGIGGIPFDWQLPVAVVLAAVGRAVLLPRAARPAVLVSGAAFAVLALPAAVDLPGWAVPALDLIAAAALLLAAVRQRADGTALVCAGAGWLLTGHAVLAALTRPAIAATVFAAVALTGLLAALPVPRPSTSGETARHRRVIAGVALTVALLAVPAGVTATLVAAGAAPQWQARGAMAAAALLLGASVALRRRYLSYTTVALVVAALVPAMWPRIAWTGEPQDCYAALGVLLLAVGLLLGPPDGVRVALRVGAALLLLRAALPAVPALGAVLAAPYRWLGAIWTGAPHGVGLGPAGGEAVGATTPAVLILLTAAAAVTGWAHGRARRALMTALPVAAAALPVTLTAIGAAWPTVPAVALVLGLAALLGAALAAPRLRIAPIGVPLGVVLTGAGLAGALPLKGTTLAALGLAIVAAGAAGAAGRTRLARTAGWLAAVAVGVTLAVVASRAADLPLHAAAFAVLAVAALALALGATLAARRPLEAVAIEAAGHGGALVALLLTGDAIRHGAAVCTLWGVALGTRALRSWRAGADPRSDLQRPRVLATMAGGAELFGWWLLLAGAQVAVPEAYTLPAALAALVAGGFALRSRPQLTSWIAYGPGLAAALLPTLGTILVTDGQPLRRLLLGAGAVLVVLVGAQQRRQAPVLLGGAALVVLALHELAAVWDLLPRWIYLAAGGFALIALAMTYERRRRDLLRLRGAVGRMT
ncbi:hypothetical protein [Micromonospora sp. NPDC049679]|uniref:SCO7613 C-terminal domain-containing membrane protein n=1 Tax=Micromonospora sp. NPDC049679 TaxID=3155920 RepID=UPI0033D9516B